MLGVRVKCLGFWGSGFCVLEKNGTGLRPCEWRLEKLIPITMAIENPCVYSHYSTYTVGSKKYGDPNKEPKYKILGSLFW